MRVTTSTTVQTRGLSCNLYVQVYKVYMKIHSYVCQNVYKFLQVLCRAENMVPKQIAGFVVTAAEE